MPEVLDRIDDRELALVDDTVVGPFSLDALRVSLGVLRGLEGIDIRQFPPRLPAEIEKRPEFEGIRIEIYPHNAARRLFHQERWTFWTAVLEPQGASTATYRGVSIPYADLGHSFASRAPALGETLPVIGKLLGHSDIEARARYAHLAQDSIHETAERIGDSIAADIL